MRANRFTFKKTKRVVTVHKGICLDLTEPEVTLLLASIRNYRTGCQWGWPGYEEHMPKSTPTCDFVEALEHLLKSKLADG